MSPAPVLAKNGGGGFLNVLSAASWINSGAMTAYAVSKAAAWSLTNGLRNELRQQGTQVLGLHVGFVETDLTRRTPITPTLEPSTRRRHAAFRSAMDTIMTFSSSVPLDIDLWPESGPCVPSSGSFSGTRAAHGPLLGISPHTSAERRPTHRAPGFHARHCLQRASVA